MQHAPSYPMPGLLMLLSRWKVRHNTKKALFIELASVAGSTALTRHAMAGKIAEVRELLALRADPTIRNCQGCTALELVRSTFGAVPPVLQKLLENSEPTVEPLPHI